MWEVEWDKDSLSLTDEAHNTEKVKERRNKKIGSRRALSF